MSMLMLKSVVVAIAMVAATGVKSHAPDACGLVTKEEVSAAAGFTVDVATPQSVGGATSCVYGAKTRESVQVRTYSGEAASHGEAMCKGGAPVQGLGDKACVVTRGPAAMLTVTTGAQLLVVVWFNAPSAGGEQGLKRIAGKALARM